MPNPQAIALPKLPELLPCPFCGGSANGPEQSGGSDERSGYNFRMHIGCRNCGVVIVAESHKDKQGWCDDAGQAESEAIANWNRRAAASGQAGWQAIETAPRDGAEVLLWREDCGQFIGSYTSGDNFPLTQNEIDMMDEEVLFQKDWFTQWPDARRLEGSEVPTLWQPLPAAPGATSPSALVASPVETPSEIERTCTTCLHAAKHGKEWPCIGCGYKGGSAFDRWEPLAASPAVAGEAKVQP